MVQVVYANLDWERAEEKLVSAIRVAFATRYIQRTKVTLIGHQVGSYFYKMVHINFLHCFLIPGIQD